MRAVILAFASMLFATAARSESITPEYSIRLHAYMKETLKDPFSAIIEETRGPRVGLVTPDVWTRWRGAIVCYQVNAKNSYGGYIGFKPYLFVYSSDGIIGSMKSDEDDSWEASIIKRECAFPADSPRPPQASESGVAH